MQNSPKPEKSESKDRQHEVFFDCHMMVAKPEEQAWPKPLGRILKFEVVRFFKWAPTNLWVGAHNSINCRIIYFEMQILISIGACSIYYRVVKGGGGSKGWGFPNIP